MRSRTPSAWIRRTAALRLIGPAFLASSALLSVGAAEAPEARPPAAAGARADPRLPEGTRTLRDVEYVPGGHERQKLDLYVPPSDAKLPLVVWVHGGAWQAGSKEGGPALRLLRQGYAVASVNYRLIQHALFPAQIEDVKAAVRWLRSHAGEHGIDPDRGRARRRPPGDLLHRPAPGRRRGRGRPRAVVVPLRAAVRRDDRDAPHLEGEGGLRREERGGHPRDPAPARR